MRDAARENLREGDDESRFDNRYNLAGNSELYDHYPDRNDAGAVTMDPGQPAVNRLRLLHCDRGSALVEFAVTGLFFFMLLFSIIEGARAIHHYNLIANGAREGARWAAVRGRDSGRMTTQAAVQNEVRKKLGGLNPTISVTWTPINQEPGAAIQVQITHTFNTIVPIARVGNVNMSATARGIVLQ